jgi:hypothetical protein
MVQPAEQDRDQAVDKKTPKIQEAISLSKRPPLEPTARIPLGFEERRQLGGHAFAALPL